MTGTGTLLQVALGGALGASLRWSLGLLLARVDAPAFPVTIIVVNVLGSAAMGVFFAYSAQRGLAHLHPFVVAGVLGGFTTFSAFSLEAFALMERGAWGAAALYVVLSVAGAIGGFALGTFVARAVLT